MKKIMENGKSVIVPMDHGVSEGPIEGLVNIEDTIKKVEKYASAVILHKGIIKSLKNHPKCGLIMHASAGTKLSNDVNNKVLVASPKEAVSKNCDGFSVHINIGGNDHETDMLEILGKISAECDNLNLPLLAMMYPRGKNVVKITSDEIALVARVGAELGADIIKCPYSGDSNSFKKVVEGCPVPVLIAGGAKSNSDIDVLSMVEGAMDAGAAGVSLGRNIFQHKNPEKMALAIRKIVMDNMEAKEALKRMME